jgi:hypothetical protein
MPVAPVPIQALKAVLLTVREALSRPDLADNLIELCTRTETATAEFREAQAELAVERDQQRRRLAEERRVHGEALRTERIQWEQEEAQRRKLLERDEDEAARKREAVNRAWEAARETRAQLRAGRLSRGRTGKSSLAAEVACEEHGPLPGCDSAIEQQPSA